MTKQCNQLYQLLTTHWQDAQSLDEALANHIRTCQFCERGLKRLARELLSCEACRLRFSDFYEATHPEYSLIDMPEREMAQVAHHLKQCAECKGEYQELALLWRMEEQS